MLLSLQAAQHVTGTICDEDTMADSNILVLCGFHLGVCPSRVSSTWASVFTGITRFLGGNVLMKC